MKNFLKAIALLAALIISTQVEAANRFAVCTVTCTWDNSSTVMWSTTTGGATGASAPGSGDSVVLDGATCVGGVTCTITVNANLNILSLTTGACTASTSGCVLDFSANNNNISVVNVSLTGAGTRTLNMGSGTWTVTGNGGTAIWDCTTCGALTLNAGTSTLVFTPSGTASGSRNFTGGGKTYSTVTISGPSAFANDSPFVISNNNTFATLNIASPNWVRLPGAGTQIVTNAINWAGTAFNSAIMIDGGSGVQSTISSANNGGIVWGVLTGVIFSGGGSFAATNSIDMKGNSGITITGPSGGGGGGGHIIGG